MDKIRLKYFATLFGLMVTCVNLYGCSPSASTQNPSEASILEIEPITPEEASAEATPSDIDANTNVIKITVANLSKIDVGMFSVLDPITNAQVNVDGVASEGSLAFQCKCPIDTTQLQWAVYDTNGELLLDSTTDLTDCKGTISILLSGEETIDDVDVFFN